MTMPNDSSALDSLLDAFDAAWQSATPPKLDDFLPPCEEGDYAEALRGLVRIDLERRLKRGEAIGLEHYLERYPELRQDADRLAQLVLFESELRRGIADLRAAQNGLAPPTKDDEPDGVRPDVSTQVDAAAPKPAAPTAGPRYRPLRYHARGGLGEVWVAQDAELNREVALKRIRPDNHEAESRRRFVIEAEVTARLGHPGIVPVYGLVQDQNGNPCYAMRFIEGETLSEAIRRFHEADAKPGRDLTGRSLALRELLGRFIVVCNTIGYAHSRRILHRDIKPGNIMLGKYGETLVVDWGLAKVIDGPEGGQCGNEEALRPSARSDGGQTRIGRAMGTPAYMSPEQAAGQWDTIGPESDVYSLGATLYCLLTGRAPFSGKNAAEVMAQVGWGDLVQPRQIKPDVHPALERICRKAMALRPQDRYGSAAELARDIERWLAGETVSVYREPRIVLLAKWCRRQPVLALYAFAYFSFGFVATLAVLYFAISSRVALWFGCVVFAPLGFILLSILVTAVTGPLTLLQQTWLSWHGTNTRERVWKSVHTLLVVLPVVQLLLFELVATYDIMSHLRQQRAEDIPVLFAGAVGILVGCAAGHFFSLIRQASARARKKYICFCASVWAIFAMYTWLHVDSAWNRATVAIADNGEVKPVVPVNTPSPFLKALEVRPQTPEAFVARAHVLVESRKYDEAVAELQKAIRLNSKFASAHAVLGDVLLRKGAFLEAQQALRRYRELLPDEPLHKLVAQQERRLAQQERECEQMIALEKKLPAVLRGEDGPVAAGEQLGLARLCLRKKRYIEAGRFYAEAQPSPADDVLADDCYDAACCAALAAAGQGEEAKSLPDKEKRMWRRQALLWLRADLSVFARMMGRPDAAAKLTVGYRLVHWQKDADLDSIRDPRVLARLPEDERKAWRDLWNEVDRLLRSVKGTGAPDAARTAP
jgi:tetratricopeptide (TPR) repeat protein